ncbi:MAG: collagen-like protein [Cyanobacteria bacterium P01_D01_bin.105]
MTISFASALPQLFTSLALSFTLPLFVAVVHPCHSVVIARTYGINGQDGRDGRDGSAGANGASRTIDASEEFIELDLRGTDGEDGERGERGDRARCRNHTQPNRDVSAADGGDGGDGGNGGDGGSGGDITVYYTNRAHLQNVSVNAGGGRGGRGGRGGDGRRGCHCHEYSWSDTSCTDGNCETQHYSCTDGDDGDDGSRGRQGEDGRTGKARIVDKALLNGERLAAENPVLEQAIAQLPATPIPLSRNLWQTRQRAQDIFNSGSVIDSTYQEYAGRADKQFQLIWDAAYPQSQASSSLKVSLDDKGTLQLQTPNDLWIDGERTECDNLTTYRVKYALLASEATNLSVGRSNGSGAQFVLNIIDLAGKSDLLETQFYVRYKTKNGDRRGRYITRYEGILSDALLSRDHNRFVLNVGQLPIDQEYLKPNTEARLEITVTRTLANNTAEQVLTWNGQT